LGRVCLRCMMTCNGWSSGVWLRLSLELEEERSAWHRFAWWKPHHPYEQVTHGVAALCAGPVDHGEKAAM
jgi:hypothetical protein